MPPADVLLRIADLTGVDLRWLLTGESALSAVPADHPVLRRAAALLASAPEAARPLAAFLDILAETLNWPAKPAPPTAADEGAAPAPPAAAAEAVAAAAPSAGAAPREAASPVEAARAAWIPILGRSAAGVPHFWADGEAGGVTTLDELIGRQADAPRTVRRASAAAAPAGTDTPVQIITLAAPDERGVAEFVAAAALKAHYPDAFALRIDGDSMAPDIRHGDVVILSPSQPAAEGQPAVVQLRGQIGVTCKLFRHVGRTVHLVPLNEQYAVQSFPVKQAVWSLRLLARVRG